jgi:hypothetical protein
MAFIKYCIFFVFQLKKKNAVKTVDVIFSIFDKGSVLQNA